MIKKLSQALILASVILLGSCESTGVCTQPITPRLMVGFSQSDIYGNEQDIPPPANLLIYGNIDGQDIINYAVGQYNDTVYYTDLYPSLVEVNTDNRIPLIFDVSNDEIVYIFDFEGITDTIKLNYLRNQSFVSVNCGYKTTFNNIELTTTNNNIIKTVLLEQTIEYDNEQHIKILIK